MLPASSRTFARHECSTSKPVWTQIERLDGHPVEHFSCGDEGIDRWLQESAQSTQAEGACAVHVAVDDAGAVLGYFTLSMTALRKMELPRGGNTRRELTPAILLGKLARHESLASSGAGTLLLFEALEKAAAAAALAGGSYLIVDVPNPLRREFYVRNNFVAFNSNPARMHMKMSTVRAALAALAEAS